MNRRLSVEEINKLDPYQFMAELGKKVIHPGGMRSTKEIYSMANLQSNHIVLDVGCGVATTAIDIVKKFGCNVVACDIDQKMLEMAEENVRRARLREKIKVMNADIQQMPFSDNEFHVIIVEAVTMFVNRKKAVKELYRVCKQQGKVIDHEFIWRKKPTQEARRIFEGEVCPGIKFDTEADWLKLYHECGFNMTKKNTGPFVMMSPTGFIQDEGITGTMSIMLKMLTRMAYAKKMMWLMPRILKVRNSLGYIVLSTYKN
jgi:ubiquinone/menaquinone biosynthesis C-methylase UbiE